MLRWRLDRWLDPWERAFHRLPEQQRTRDDLIVDETVITPALTAAGVPCHPYHIDVEAFREWRQRASYEQRHPDYYPTNLDEKSLEHYLAAKLSGFTPGQRIIDIASQTGVACDVYERLYGVETYRQDLDYPTGLHGREIGGDAARMEIPDAFADALTLHCSFEHFEGDSDRGFIREAGRVLRPGGTLVIAPLYLSPHYAAITYPPYSAGKVRFEPDQRVHALRHWQNRFGRFYDAAHFVQRVWDERGALTGEVLAIANRSEVGPSIYMRFVLVLRKPAQD